MHSLWVASLQSASDSQEGLQKPDSIAPLAVVLTPTQMLPGRPRSQPCAELAHSIAQNPLSHHSVSEQSEESRQPVRQCGANDCVLQNDLLSQSALLEQRGVQVPPNQPTMQSLLAGQSLSVLQSP